VRCALTETGASEATATHAATATLPVQLLA